jgi:hypothetical protein
MPLLDAATGNVLLPLWAIAGLGALIVVLVLLALASAGARPTFAALAQLTVVAALIAFGWNYLDQLNGRDRAEERRAVTARLNELTMRAIAPGSPLACLDGHTSDAVAAACEKALFARPETTAAAQAYVEARFNLLADLVNGAGAAAADESAIAALRRSAELDRFGLLAHLLEARDGCSPDHCDAFVLLDDPSRVVANMKTHAFDGFVSRHVANWQNEDGPALAAAESAAPGSIAAAHAAVAPAQHPVSINFPTAASIPAVSIMNNEPGMPGQNGVDSAPKPAAKTEGATKSEAKPAAKPVAKPVKRSAAAKPDKPGAPEQTAGGAETAPLPVAPAVPPARTP